MERSDKLARVTITLPGKLMEEVENRVSVGMFATPTEWIRNAIRTQLQREESPMDRLIASDARVAESINQAEAGQLVAFDFDDLIVRMRS